MPDGLLMSSLQKIYFRLESKYFNDGFAIDFSGDNNGTGVDIYYLDHDKRIYEIIKEKQFQEKINKLYDHALQKINGKLINEFSTSLIFPIVGYLAKPIIYIVSKKLELHDYRIILNNRKYILVKKIVY